MAWNGSGVFSRTNGVHVGATVWVQDRDASVLITAPRHDTHDEDISDGINACLAKNGENAATANLNMGSKRLTLMANASSRADAINAGQIQDASVIYAADAEASDTYVIALSPAITAYAIGMIINFKVNTKNTGPATLNVNTVGAKTIKKNGSADLDDGDLLANSIHAIIYDGTNFQLLTPVFPENTPQSPTLVINGAMDVDQEAGSFTGVGAATQKYVVDQWAIHTNGSPQGRATVTQESGVFAGFGSSLKIDCTTAEAAVAAGESWTLQQRFEAQDLQHLNYGAASAKSLVCTFNIKSPKSGIHCVALYQNDGSRSFVREFTVASANTAEEITVTFPGDASGTINNDTGEGLRLSFPLVAGSTYQVAADDWAAGEDYATSNQQNLLDNTANNFEITGVRLRLGTIATATPFKHKGFGEVLRLCDRYYQRYNSGAVEDIAVGVNDTATTSRAPFQLRSAMRADPTFSVSGAADFELRHQDPHTTTATSAMAGRYRKDGNGVIDATVASGLTIGGAARLGFDGVSKWFALESRL